MANTILTRLFAHLSTSIYSTPRASDGLWDLGFTKYHALGHLKGEGPCMDMALKRISVAMGALEFAEFPVVQKQKENHQQLETCRQSKQICNR